MGMTENEAIEILKNTFPKTCKMGGGRYKGGFDDTECEFGKALLLSISALEEIQQYRSIGTVEECREVMGKQQEKKVKNRKLRMFNENPYSVQGNCPSCGREGLLSMNTNYCNACGQKLDWNE